jgi:threonine/homoserine/homoserine lactone efflux protein
LNLTNSRAEEPSRASVRRALAERVFSTSAQLVGVCMTVIGLFRVVFELKNINSIADNLMAIDALVFLGSCLLSYLALRSIRAERSLALEQAADVVFLAGLGMMVVVCALVAYELI